MSQQQDRLSFSCAAQPGHQVALAWRGRKHLDLIICETRGFEPRRHRFGRLGGVAGCRHRIDLDQFLVDVVGELLLCGQSIGGGTRDQCRGKYPR